MFGKSYAANKKGVLAVAILLATVGLAGCLSNPSTTASPLVAIARVVTIEFDQDDMERSDAKLEDFVKSTYELRVTGISYDATLLTVTYTDAKGTLVSKTLKEITNQAELAPGTPGLIPGVDFSSGVAVKLGDETIASRGGIPLQSWNIDGMPLGFRMAPGSNLQYDVATRGFGEFGISDYSFEMDPEAPPVVIDRALERFDLRQTGTVGLKVGSALETVTSTDGSRTWQAYPIDFTFEGGMTVDEFLVEAVGKMDDEAFDVGADLTKGSVSGKVEGVLHVEDTLRLVKSKVTGGMGHADAHLVAWYEGIPADFAESMPCPTATRASPCAIEEFNSEFPVQEAMESGEEEDLVSEDGPDMLDEALRTVKRILQADMMKGDAFRVHISMDASGQPGAPEQARMDYRFEVEVGDVETVQTKAGSMRAYKLTETQSLTANVGAFEEEGFVFNGIQLNEEPVRTTIWLHETSFAPVKVEYDFPFDVSKVINKVLDAIGKETWENLGPNAVRPSDIRINVEGGGTMEVGAYSGDIHFQPWAGLVYAHLLTGASAASFAALGTAVPGYNDEPGYAEEVPREAYSSDLIVEMLGAVEGDDASTVPPDGAANRITCNACETVTMWVRVHSMEGAAAGANVAVFGSTYAEAVADEMGMARVVIPMTHSSPDHDSHDGMEEADPGNWFDISVFHEAYGRGYLSQALYVEMA